MRRTDSSLYRSTNSSTRGNNRPSAASVGGPRGSDQHLRANDSGFRGNNSPSADKLGRLRGTESRVRGNNSGSRGNGSLPADQVGGLRGTNRRSRRSNIAVRAPIIRSVGQQHHLIERVLLCRSYAKAMRADVNDQRGARLHS